MDGGNWRRRLGGSASTLAHMPLLVAGALSCLGSVVASFAGMSAGSATLVVVGLVLGVIAVALGMLVIAVGLSAPSRQAVAVRIDPTNTTTPDRG